MLGAQARAAELQAAKSAAMRQRAHREAEDQAFPPEAAPVSLTDFARNHLLNKNKGAKAFRPLMESDFEATKGQSDVQTSISEPSSVHHNRIMPPGMTPTAPRAMLFQSESHPTKITPTRALAPAFTPRNHLVETPNRLLGVYQDRTSASPYTNTVENANNYIFGPDDLSPEKQEIKFAEMRQQYAEFEASQNRSHCFPLPLVPEARMVGPLQSYTYDADSHNNDCYMQQAFDIHAYSRPSLQHYQSENGTSATSYGIMQTYAERKHFFAEELMDHHQRVQQKYQNSKQLRTTQSVHDHDSEQPYDRLSKMQSFVAAQQAMARKGKTVLHNPDLYKSPQQAASPSPEFQSYVYVSPAPLYGSHSASISEVDTRHETAEDQNLDDKHAIVRALTKRDEAPNDAAMFQSFNQQQGDLFFKVEDAGARAGLFPGHPFSDDWYRLNSITQREREKMLRIIRIVEDEPITTFNSTLVKSTTCVTGSIARKWFINGERKVSARQAVLREIVADHERRSDTSPAYGIIGRPITKEKLDLSLRGALSAVAEIMDSLHANEEERQSHDHCNQYTSTPVYAIDMSDKTGATNMVGASLFDDLSVRTLQHNS